MKDGVSHNESQSPTSHWMREQSHAVPRGHHVYTLCLISLTSQPGFCNEQNVYLLIHHKMFWISSIFLGAYWQALKQEIRRKIGCCYDSHWTHKIHDQSLSVNYLAWSVQGCDTTPIIFTFLLPLSECIVKASQTRHQETMSEIKQSGLALQVV